MISLYHNTEDSFSLYGIQHFIEKTGIAIEINKPSTSGIAITYGIERKGEFLINIEKNDVQNHICGRISLDKEKIPLCEIPHDTGSGRETFAYFETAEKRYPCQTTHEGRIDIGIDIFKETGYLLSGHLDTIRQKLDETTRTEITSIPIVDALENLLFSSILNACDALHIPLVQKSYWPDNKSFAVCLTHDVDELKKTYQYVTRPVMYILGGNLQGLKGQLNSFFQKIKGNEPYWTFEDIFAIEKTFRAKSTYFILKESGKPMLLSKQSWSVYGRNRSLESPEMQMLIQKLITNGDEIGVHGSYFSYKNPQLLLQETRELEQLINTTGIGTRQHHLNLNIPETWEYQIQAGLKYDSSLGFNDAIGFRWGTSFPFFPHNGIERIDILEIPLIIMDNYLETLKNKEKAWLSLAEEVERYQGVLTLLWHSCNFNTLEYPGYRDTYVKIIQYCQEKGAWIARAGDIYEWIYQRNRQTFSYFYKDSTCTIIPSDTRSELFFTVYLPQGTDAIIHSENVDIIGREGNYMSIKTHDINNNNEIVLGIV